MMRIEIRPELAWYHLLLVFSCLILLASSFPSSLLAQEAEPQDTVGKMEGYVTYFVQRRSQSIALYHDWVDSTEEETTYRQGTGLMFGLGYILRGPLPPDDLFYSQYDLAFAFAFGAFSPWKMRFDAEAGFSIGVNLPSDFSVGVGMRARYGGLYWGAGSSLSKEADIVIIDFDLLPEVSLGYTFPSSGTIVYVLGHISTGLIETYYGLSGNPNSKLINEGFRDYSIRLGVSF